MVWPTEGELGVLKKLGVGIVHNPQSNMKLASGTAPVPEMLKENCQSGSALMAPRQTTTSTCGKRWIRRPKLHKLISNDPKVVNAQDAFEMADNSGCARDASRKRNRLD
jgi:5-methylthioadenosine/S-adenosylhomocysteine deaminase